MSTYANRGMGFEALINYANEQYLAREIANIQKVSTPWKVVRQGSRIVNAFPEGKSTVDYMGDYKGRSICFEAKSTEVETRFPLSNFERHQIDVIRSWRGIAFALLHFENLQETYLLTKEQLLHWWDGQFKDGRKSIPLAWIRENARRIGGPGSSRSVIVLDYLQVVDQVVI
ncbi:Holliday junction resolvase RecU [Paenibacillus sp. JX-17]|uniref:Holliday junction resolvase RecU n=1 Tax=Paenibacillus lacisoli TaxID=3064525 RepID=A0ABT9CIU4_9BACL|nr:Holliday junction resolvase RecU [Paenibacillus sp. JX-17]MDO7908453.1 Holliday junction resolvase RecU [Paenibacillus sp. JX-17]